jgi:ketosteroid isomerase-like protein
VRSVDLDETIDAYHQALGELVKGDPEPLKRMYSHSDDVTLANPWGPATRGWANASAAMERAASQFRDGAPQSRPHELLARLVGADLACLVENERWQAKVSGRSEVSPFELRVTTVFRLDEEQSWEVVHRHADPVTTVNPDGVLAKPG